MGHPEEESHGPADDSASATVPLVGYGATQASDGKTNTRRSRGRQYAPSSWWKRIGLFHLATLMFGSAIIIIIFAGLGLLWNESLAAQGLTESKAGGGLLRRIAATAWAPKIVTLCTAVLRFIIVAQAGLFTSMAAALLLERVGVPFPDAPFYSIARAFQPQPHTLLANMVGGVGVGKVSRSWSPLKAITYFLVIFELFAALASQFLSTAMISDFGDAVIDGLANSSTPVGSTYGAVILSGDDYWANPPAANWRFAEAEEDPDEEPAMIAEGIFDTGHAYRAFLPFGEQQQRVSLREYEGPADVLDFRVVCVSPKLDDLIQATVGSDSVLKGNITIDKSYPMLENTPNAEPFEFVCPIPDSLAWIDGTVSELTSLCYVRRSTIQLKDPLASPDEDPITATQYLIIDSIYDMETFNTTHTWPSRVARTQGSWSIVANDQGDDILRVTSCFVNQGPGTFSVKMDSAQDGAEPTTSWDREENTYNTTSSLQQLGVISAKPTSSSLQDRGLLTLNARTEWVDINATELRDPADPDSYHASIYSAGMGNAMDYRRSPNRENYLLTDPFVFLSNRSSSEGEAVHGSHFALFQHALRVTGNAAPALQALLTRVSQMIHYDTLQRGEPRGQATTAFASTVFLPVRWYGLMGSAIVVAVHLCATFAAAIFFLLATDKSELGDIWQAVSHVVTDDTLPVLKRAGTLRDQDVPKLVGSEFPDMLGNGILARREDGMVTFRVGYKGSQ